MCLNIIYARLMSIMSRYELFVTEHFHLFKPYKTEF